MQVRQSGSWSTAWHILAAASILYFAWFAGWFTRGCYATWNPVLAPGPFAWMAIEAVWMYGIFIFEKSLYIVTGVTLTFLVCRFVLPPIDDRIIHTAWTVVFAVALALYVIAQVTTRPLGGCVP